MAIATPTTGSAVASNVNPRAGVTAVAAELTRREDARLPDSLLRERPREARREIDRHAAIAVGVAASEMCEAGNERLRPDRSPRPVGDLHVRSAWPDVDEDGRLGGAGKVYEGAPRDRSRSSTFVPSRARPRSARATPFSVSWAKPIFGRGRGLPAVMRCGHQADRAVVDDARAVHPRMMKP